MLLIWSIYCNFCAAPLPYREKWSLFWEKNGYAKFEGYS